MKLVSIEKSVHYVYCCLSIFLLANMYACSDITSKAAEDQRPNILLLVADDLGYADLGCYGGDIETPNIDIIASGGIRFSSFHTAPVCAPTRAMLLSGNDNHIAGMGNMLIDSQEDFGYEKRLTNRIVTIPTLLKQAGYHTYMAGKWHLGSAPNQIHIKKALNIPLFCSKELAIITMVRVLLMQVTQIILKTVNLQHGKMETIQQIFILIKS